MGKIGTMVSLILMSAERVRRHVKARLIPAVEAKGPRLARDMRKTAKSLRAVAKQSTFELWILSRGVVSRNPIPIRTQDITMTVI